MTLMYAAVAFLAGMFYAQHDDWRFIGMVVVGLLLWVLRDELRERA